MKPTEFIVENSIIAQEADDMHRDHEVQMARSQLYSAAQAAIQIHRLLKNVSEMEGLEGWVQTKIAVASEYLESVQDYLKYEAVSQQSEMMPFAEAAANYAVEKIINEEFADKDVDAAVSKYIKSGGKIEKGKTHGARKSEKTDFGSKHIGGRGEVGRGKSVRIGKSAKTNPEGKPVVTAESATGGASSAGGVATSMTGPANKKTSGVPKKVGNAYKPKKVEVGKGVY
jgi:hypothetical protein